VAVETHSHIFLLRTEYDQMVGGLKEVNDKFATLEARAEAAEAKLKKYTDGKRKAAEEARKFNAKINDSQKALKAISGDLGGATGKLLTLGKGFGIVGVAGLALGLALGVAIKGSLALATAAGSAEKRIRDLKIVSVEQSAAVREMAEAHASLGTQTDVLTTKIGSALSPQITTLIHLMAGATIATGLMIDELESASKKEIKIGGHTLPSLGKLTEAFAAIVKATHPGLAGLLGFGEALVEIGEAADESVPVDDATERAKQNAEASRRAAEALREWERQFNDSIRMAKDWQRAIDDISAGQRKHADIIAGANSDIMTSQEEVLRARDLALRESDDLFEKGVITEKQHADEIIAINQRMAREIESIRVESDGRILDAAIEANAKLADLQNEAISEVGNAAFDLADIVIDRISEAIRAEYELLDADKERTQARIDAINQELESNEDLTDAERENLDMERDRGKEHIKLINDRLKEEKKAMIAAWRVAQAAAVGQVIFNTAQAYMAMVASLSLNPLTAPAAPGLAAALVFPASAVQLGAIAAQQAPKFHTGGLMPDEMMFGPATVRHNEAAVVFSERAVQDGAVEDAMDRNRGTPRDQRPIVLGNFGRVVGRVVLEELGDPSSDLSRALGSSSGIVSVYGRAA
jgi:hypothetical protein